MLQFYSSFPVILTIFVMAYDMFICYLGRRVFLWLGPPEPVTPPTPCGGCKGVWYTSA